MNLRIIRNVLSFVLSGLIVVTTGSGCQKTNDTIPYSPVNEYLNLSLPSYLNLNAVNGWVYDNNAGYRGLIIINTGNNVYAAFDRACTYDYTLTGAQIRVAGNSIEAIDSTCYSKFSILDGSVIKGPAERPLKRYRTEILSNNVLHIYN